MCKPKVNETCRIKQIQCRTELYWTVGRLCSPLLIVYVWPEEVFWTRSARERRWSGASQLVPAAGGRTRAGQCGNVPSARSSLWPRDARPLLSARRDGFCVPYWISIVGRCWARNARPGGGRERRARRELSEAAAFVTGGRHPPVTRMLM